MGETQERTFFSNGNVTVTNARLIVDGQTYAMSSVTSVAAASETPSRLWSVLLGLFALMMIPAQVWPVVGVLAALAVWMWVKQKPKYWVSLSTSGGEKKAVWSHDRDWIQSIVDALNNAIVARG
jgi:hypothetical protein